MTIESKDLMTTVKRSKDTVNTSDLETRVGRLEGTMEALAEEVKQTNENLQSFAKDTHQSINQLVNQVGHIKDSLVKEISDVKDLFSCQLSQKIKPDWSMILSVIGLITTIMVMGATLIAFMFSGQTERININNAKIATIEQQFMEKNYEHGQISNWMKNSEEKIKHLDSETETLRLWKIEHIEDHAQFKEKDGKIESDIDYLKKEIDRLRNNDKISVDSIQFVQP